MRPHRLIVSAAVTAGLLSMLCSTTASADGSEGVFEQTVAVEASLPGFDTPAEISGSGNPCEGQDPYTKFVSFNDPRFVREDDVQFYAPVTPGIPSEDVFALLPPADGTWRQWNQPVTAPTHEWWVAACVDPITNATWPAGTRGAWVPVVTQAVVVAALSQRLEDLLTAPVVSWPSMDREFGWLYVKAPMDFRIAPPAAVSLTASVTNVTGSVSATVSATPTSLLFEPGEPGGGSVSCSVQAATAGYSASTPGQCSYTYQNSSAIASGGEFGWRATLLWQVTTSAPEFGPRVLPTVSYGTVAVAEAQAVVTG